MSALPLPSTLKTPETHSLFAHAPDPRPPQPHIAKILAKGGFFLPSGSLEITPELHPFSRSNLHPPLLHDIHGFSWLRHLTTPDFAAHGRRLVLSWLQCKPPRAAHLPRTKAQRLASWISAAPALFSNAPQHHLTLARNAVKNHFLSLDSFPAQNSKLPIAHNLQISAAVAFARLALLPPPHEKSIEPYLQLLQNSVLADGGLPSRSPEDSFLALLDALRLQNALASNNHKPPQRLLIAVKRLAGAVKFHLHRDDALSCHHGGREQSPQDVQSLLEQSPKIKSFAVSHRSSYQRFSAKNVVVLMDDGAPPDTNVNPSSQHGALSFEMSAGKHRIIVNPGPHSPPYPPNSSPPLPSAPFLNDAPPEPARSFFSHAPSLLVTRRRQETPDGAWHTAQHNGYEHLGVILSRRLFLHPNGTRLLGEDSLSPAARRSKRPKPMRLVVHFNLHPDVRAALTQDQLTVLLSPPDRKGWRFLAQSTHPLSLSLKPSSYAGAKHPPRPSRRITLTVRGVHPHVNWAFQKAS